MMPQLYFDEIDVLIIDEMGKNISGAGFDPNITGRNRRAVEWVPRPLVKKIVVLGLTRETMGNATGIGSADVITMRLYREFDVPSTYANIITSCNLDGAAIPMIMNTRPRGHRPGGEDRRTGQAAGLPHRAHPQHAAARRKFRCPSLCWRWCAVIPSASRSVSAPAPLAFDANGTLAAADAYAARRGRLRDLTVNGRAPARQGRGVAGARWRLSPCPPQPTRPSRTR